MDTSITSGISVILASYFNISPSNIFAIQPLINYCITVISNFDFEIIKSLEEYYIDIPTYIYTVVILIGIIGYVSRGIIKRYYDRLVDYFSTTSTIYFYGAANSFEVMQNLKSINAMKPSQSYRIGNNSIMSNDDVRYTSITSTPTVETYFSFEMDNMFIDGYIMCSYVKSKIMLEDKNKSKNMQNTEGSQVIDAETPLVIIKLNRKMTYSDFFCMLKKKCNSDVIKKNEKTVKLKAYTYNAYEGDSRTFYTTILRVDREIYNSKDYIRNYFHQELDLIKNIAKLEYINLIFHGPSGVGKTKLIYKLAKVTQRHIVSIDLCQFTPNKLYTYFNITRSMVHGGPSSINDYGEREYEDTDKVIFVIENIEETIKFITAKEKNMQNNIKQLLQNKKKPVDIKEYYANIDKQLTLNDLMNILLPINPPADRWVIATTSTKSYNNMRSLNSELFTPGRLTPLEFKYVDQRIFDLITIYYYNTPNIITIPINHTVPTSYIIQTIKIYRNDLQSFSTKIQEIFDKNQDEIAEIIKLKGSKIMINKAEVEEIVTTFFKVPRNKYNPEAIISSYFNNDKVNIINYINNLSTFNLMLHGPPGTGKSKLIEVIAKVKERHIISICLKNHNKYEINDMLSRPMIDNDEYKPKDVIIVLEEFDQSFKYLVDKEETLKKATTTQEHYSKCRDELYMGDLLEIFQSSIPREGQIIIATSNHFEDMSQTKPALFRPGRLTPLYIGYINQQVFNELVEYYFHVTTDIQLPEDHKIPTSQITEFALLANNNYNIFKENMMKLV